jgi:hypothetical protein
LTITLRKTLARPSLLGWIAASIVLTSAPSAPSQGDSRPATHEFRIAGRIVNSSTGEPLARAAVAALAQQDNHVVASVLSDADGHFAIEHLPAGKYPLTASKRGFRTALYDEHEDFNTAIVTGDGQDTEHLQFQLAPAAVLRGIVTADGGDPVESASVLLFKRPDPTHPGERITQVDGANTDDTGAYEFSNLPAGEYFVAVKADPWYALRGPTNRSPDNSASSLDVAYPLTFFDSTVDEASAAPIALTVGSREEASVNLHAVPALHLTLPRSVRRGAPPVELRQTVFGTQIQSHGADLLTVQQGTLEVTGIAPGHYELTHGDPPRTLDLDVASNLEIGANAGTPAVSVTGTLHYPSGAPIDEDANLVLESADDAVGKLHFNTFAHKGQFQFDAVLPGRWVLSVYVASSGQSLSVVTVVYGGRALAGNQIVVAEQPLNIAVAVSRAETRIEGFARINGKPAVGVMVVLVPREPAAYQSLVRRDQSDSDGSFALRNVPPGQYTVIAIEDGWKLDWRRRETIARYLAAGVSVSVGAGSGVVVRLAQPVAAVPR